MKRNYYLILRIELFFEFRDFSFFGRGKVLRIVTAHLCLISLFLL